MSRCIVHFGMFKTGSTAIQHALFSSPQNDSFRYVHAGRANSSFSIKNAFVNDPVNLHINVLQGATNEEVLSERSRIRRDIDSALRSDASTLIISGEAILNLKIQELEEFHDFLSDRVSDVVAVGYAREARGAIESGFQQRMKLRKPWKGNLSNVLPKYERVLSKFEEVFGRDKVSIWRYSPAEFPNGDVVQDFVQRIGIKCDAVKSEKRNTTLSRDAVGLLYSYRMAEYPWIPSKEGVRADHELINCLGELKGPSLKFSNSILSPILRRYRSDLDWIEARVGADMSHLGEDDPASIEDERQIAQVSEHAKEWLRRKALEAGADAEDLADRSTPEIIEIWRQKIATGLRRRTKTKIKDALQDNKSTALAS